MAVDMMNDFVFTLEAYVWASTIQNLFKGSTYFLDKYIVKGRLFDFELPDKAFLEYCLLNRFSRIDKIENKRINLAITYTVESGERLYAFYTAEMLVNYHGVEKRLIEAGLVFFCDDENVEVVMELCLRLFL